MFQTMKKVSFIVLTALLLVFGICIVTGAADPPQALTLTVAAPAVADAGDTCDVVVKFSENTGFNTLGVTLSYPEGFTFQSAQVSSLIEESFALTFAGYSGPVYEFSDDPENRELTFVGASIEDITASSGTVFTATFMVAENIANGSGYTFGVEYTDNIYSADSDTGFAGEVDNTLGNTSGFVNSGDHPFGDINFDDSANILDAILSLKFVSGKEIPTASQKEAADIKHDGNLNILDAIAVLQIIAGKFNG